MDDSFVTKLIYDSEEKLYVLSRENTDLICPYSEHICSSICPQFGLRIRRLESGSTEQILTLHCTKTTIAFRDGTTGFKKEEYNAKAM